MSRMGECLEQNIYFNVLATMKARNRSKIIFLADFRVNVDLIWLRQVVKEMKEVTGFFIFVC